jgi:hypothetical protein
MTSIILKAYLNEIEIDKSSLGLIDKKYQVYYDKYLYKPLKVSVMSNSLYFVFRIVTLLYTRTWAILILIIVMQYLKSIFKEHKKLISTHIGLITGHNSKRNIEMTKISNIKYINIRDHTISSFLSTKEQFESFKLALKTIHTFKRTEKSLNTVLCNSMKLHMLDLFFVSNFITFLNVNDMKRSCFLMGNHYDRWAYIVSWTLKKSESILIQHGYLNNDLKLPYKLGVLSQLHVYNICFVEQFKRYYKNIKYNQIISGGIQLTNKNGQKPKLIIISSLPYVDYELDIIDKLIKNGIVNISVKTHPGYSYKDKFNKFSKYLIFVEKDIFPDANIIITYNSFLGYEYLSQNKKVFWINEYLLNIDHMLTKIITEIKNT